MIESRAILPALGECVRRAAPLDKNQHADAPACSVGLARDCQGHSETPAIPGGDLRNPPPPWSRIWSRVVRERTPNVDVRRRSEMPNSLIGVRARPWTTTDESGSKSLAVKGSRVQVPSPPRISGRSVNRWTRMGRVSLSRRVCVPGAIDGSSGVERCRTNHRLGIP